MYLSTAFDSVTLYGWDPHPRPDIFGKIGESGVSVCSLEDAKVLYGSWCCSRTNFHHPGATAFVSRPPKLPVGAEATRAREAAGR